uniref:DUF3857 domain-containing protein n=1 Tax=Roseivirga sp. TaxID=1964215 RepID=UPI00404768A5
MKKSLIKPLLVAIYIPLFFQANAQRETIAFGLVGMNDLQSQKFEKYTGAEAVVIFDSGKAQFIDEDGSFYIIFERTKRIKILSQSGSEYANISIPFYKEDAQSYETVYDIQAISHTLSGYIEKSILDKNDIYETKITNNWYEKRFAIPAVKEGSVIEYKYTLRSPFMFNLPDWEFQHKIPTIYSEYEVHVVPFYEYTYLAQGINRFDYSNSRKGTYTRRLGTFEYNEIIYEFAMKDVPAFTDLTYITSVNDYIIKMDWQLSRITYSTGSKRDIMTTWPEMVESMLKSENFGRYIKSSTNAVEKMMKSDPELKEITGLNGLTKINRATQYVKNNYSWNGLRGKYSTKNTKEFLKETTGSTAELNLFLVGFLRAMNINAHPIILSTRDHGKIKADYPFESFFNTIAVLIENDGQFILTEATEKLLPLGKLPPDYLNDYGLIVDKDKQGWVNLNINVPSVEKDDMLLTLSPDDLQMKGSFKKTLTDYEAIPYKRDKKLIYKELDKNYSVTEEIDYTINTDPSEPLVISYEATFPLSHFEGKYYFQPFLDKAPTSNPFKAEKRTYPVDFIYSQKKQFSSVVELGAGFEITSTPDNVNFQNDLVDFSFEILTDPSQNKVTSISTYILKKAVYEPKDYVRLKNYLDQITTTFKKQIVIEKK